MKNDLMISGTLQASPTKLNAVIVILKAYQNTKRHFQKSDLCRHNAIITKNNGNIRTFLKQILYRSKGNDESFPKI